MSRRTHGRNSFETNLDGAINDSQTTATVDSSTGLTQPGYFTIDPESPTLREYIKVAVIAGTAWSTIIRGLPGSAAGAQAHADNVLIRSAPVHQHLEDTFDDIEDLEAADTAHFGGTDIADHPEATGSVRGFLSAADKTIIDAADHGVLSGLTDDDHTQYPLKSIATTKGDLWVATGSGVLVRVGVGIDGQVVVADSGETAGVKWVTTELEGSTEVAGPITMGIPIVERATVTLNIPTEWSSWDCYVAATFGLVSAEAATQMMTYTCQIEIDGTLQQNQPSGFANISTFAWASGAVAGRRTGMTTTGNRTIELHASRVGPDDVDIQDIFLYARAVRAS